MDHPITPGGIPNECGRRVLMPSPKTNQLMNRCILRRSASPPSHTEMQDSIDDVSSAKRERAKAPAPAPRLSIDIPLLQSLVASSRHRICLMLVQSLSSYRSGHIRITFTFRYNTTSVIRYTKNSLGSTVPNVDVPQTRPPSSYLVGYSSAYDNNKG